MTENIAETEAWELVEHAAQFRGAPICETQHFSKFVSFCVAQVCAGNWRKEINIMKRCFFLHSIGRICISYAHLLYILDHRGAFVVVYPADNYTRHCNHLPLCRYDLFDLVPTHL